MQPTWTLRFKNGHLDFDFRRPLARGQDSGPLEDDVGADLRRAEPSANGRKSHSEDPCVLRYHYGCWVFICVTFRQNIHVTVRVLLLLIIMFNSNPNECEVCVCVCVCLEGTLFG